MRVTFILADTHATHIAAVYENEHRPYRKRTVSIELTPEQVAALKPRPVGVLNGVEQVEELLECFVDSEPTTDKEEKR